MIALHRSYDDRTALNDAIMTTEAILGMLDELVARTLTPTH
jgi:hypothetical protein